MYYLNSHLDQIPSNLGDASDKQGVRFHTYLKIMEEHSQSRWDSQMIVDYCGCLKTDLPPTRKCSRKVCKRNITGKASYLFSFHLSHFYRYNVILL